MPGHIFMRMASMLPFDNYAKDSALQVLSNCRQNIPGRFQQSKVRLLDSMIYCCSLKGETKVVPAQDRRRLHR